MSDADARSGRLVWAGQHGVRGVGVDVAGPVGFVWLVCASVGFGDLGRSDGGRGWGVWWGPGSV